MDRTSNGLGAGEMERRVGVNIRATAPGRARGEDHAPSSTIPVLGSNPRSLPDCGGGGDPFNPLSWRRRHRPVRLENQSPFFPEDSDRLHKKHHLWAGDREDKGPSNSPSSLLSGRCPILAIRRASCRWLRDQTAAVFFFEKKSKSPIFFEHRMQILFIKK